MCMNQNPNCDCFECRFSRNIFYKNGTKRRIIRLGYYDMPDDIQELVDAIHLHNADAIRACVASGTDVNHRLVVYQALAEGVEILDLMQELGMRWDKTAIGYVHDGSFAYAAHGWVRNGCVNQMLDYLMAKGISPSVLGVRIIRTIWMAQVDALDYLVSRGLFDLHEKHNVNTAINKRSAKMSYPCNMHTRGNWVGSLRPLKEYLQSKEAWGLRDPRKSK